jgi:hypothetical protein
MSFEARVKSNSQGSRAAMDKIVGGVFILSCNPRESRRIACTKYAGRDAPLG